MTHLIPKLSKKIKRMLNWRTSNKNECILRSPNLKEEALKEEALAKNSLDYRLYHQVSASEYRDISGCRILVVGCGYGYDCQYFVDQGASYVIGLDISEAIGQASQNPSVSYVRASAEAIPIEDNFFDLVFSYATLEHVPDIRSAFREMVRVSAPKGFIYSAAAPLWCCRSGPHWGSAFDDNPWPHLRLSVEEVIALGEQYLLAGSTNPYHQPEQIRYLLTQPIFNRRRAHEYIDSCAVIPDIKIHANFIDFEKNDGRYSHIIADLVNKGYSTFDLFGMTHMFIAEKVRV